MTFANARQPFQPEWIARMRDRRGRASARLMERARLEMLADEAKRWQAYNQAANWVGGPGGSGGSQDGGFTHG